MPAYGRSGYARNMGHLTESVNKEIRKSQYDSLQTSVFPSL